MRKKIIKSPNKERKGTVAAAAFENMGQCESETGIPRSSLEEFSAAGCPAFRHGRVYLLDLVRWMIKQENNGTSPINWSALSEELDAKLKQVKLSAELRELIEKEEVESGIQSFSSILFGALKRMTLEFPRNLEMRPREFIKEAFAAVYKETLERCRAEVKKLQGKESRRKAIK